MTPPTSPSAERERKALQAIRTLRKRLEETERAASEPIAIVGLSCRFPGAPTPDTYWSLLAEERDAVREIPPERYDVAALYDRDRDAAGRTYSRWAGLIDGVDEFDAEFFGLSPREAAQTDPQQRLFLQESWRALENAGLAPNRLAGTATGVFVGVTTWEYARRQDHLVAPEDISAYSVQGIALNAIPGRVAHVLGLQGPAMAIDTACSSSLVAIDRACRSLRDGECNLALAGGVNVVCEPDALIAASRWGMFAADGRCKSFSSLADGFVRGEGCGVVVLKRLSAAVASGERVLAVIRGSAVNHDGPSSGLTVPNGLAQQALIRRALAAAGVAPSLVGYVEAHGTGTALGDPIEAEALGAVFAASRAPDRPLVIGSVKTNLGHLEAAAGVAGLIKVVLALGRGALPGQLHCQEPSPHIRWAAARLAVAQGLQPWAPIEGRRIAGVSAFGFSGTNAHLVVEEAPAAPARGEDPPRAVEVLSLSARSREALTELAQGWRARLGAADAAEPGAWADLCHTAGVGRARFPHRLSVRGADAAAARAGLEAFLGGREASEVVLAAAPERAPRIGFLFTGQGAQSPGMGAQLYRASPLFRRRIDHGEALLRDRLEVPLGAVMRGEHPDAARLLNQTLYTQPALYLFEHALAELWGEAGIVPAAAVGHSLGEYVGAALAGVFGFEEGLALVADRARLMHEAPGQGAMAGIGAGEAEIAPLIAAHPGVDLAAVNGPRQVVVSGERAGVAALGEAARARGWTVSPLPVSQAFHSALMAPVAAAFEARAGELAYGAPRFPLVSNLTGAPIAAVAAGYWRRHLVEPVRFAEGVGGLHALGCDLLLEIGPRAVLAPLARQILGPQGPRVVASLKGSGQEWVELAEALQALDAAGAAIDWAGWNGGRPRRRLWAPTYPFARRRHWIAPAAPRPAAPAPGYGRRGEPPGGEPGGLLGGRLRSALDSIQFESRLAAEGETAWLGDHRVGGRVLVPATALIEIMLAAGHAAGRGGRGLAGLAIRAPLALVAGRPRTVQTVVDPPGPDGAARVRVFALEEDGPGFSLHAEARLIAPEASPAAVLDLDALQVRCPRRVEGEAHYRDLEARQARFGPAFRGVERLFAGAGEALGEVRLPDGLPVRWAGGGRPHPALLDACLQTAAAALAGGEDTYLPVALDRIELVASDWPAALRVHAHLTRADPDQPELAFTLADPQGRPCARLHGLRFRKIPKPDTSQDQENAEDQAGSAYVVRWRRAPHAVAPAPAGRWLMVPDAEGRHRGIVEALTRAGIACEMLGRDGIGGALAASAATGAPVDGILDCSALSFDLDPSTDPGQALARCTAAYATALESVQAAAGVPVRIAFVTDRAAPLAGSPGKPVRDLLSALARTARAESPDLDCRLIDVSLDEADAPASLIRELAHHGEPEVALRADGRWIPRLAPLDRPECFAGDHVRSLRAASSGLLEDLEFVTWPRIAPGPNEVEIRVEAAGVNFREVLVALGMSPGDPARLGGECAGVIVRTGPGATLPVGAAVLAFCPGQSGTFVVAAERYAALKPAELSFAQAAALPIAYMTALYGLDRLAQLAPGQTVLVHAGSGGLGTAAIRVALARGATVYATAGTEEKRRYVVALGTAAAMDSRSVAFADDIRRLTNGRGVDVVLNSLSGELLEASLASTAVGGVFLEAGKRGVLTPEAARTRRPDIRYHLFDLGEAVEAEAGLGPALIREMLSGIEAGRLTPLPVREFPFEKAEAAFRTMALARHTGKLVLVHRSRPERPAAEGAYAITGGYGALGLQVADWLVDRGVSTLLLIGRSRPLGVAESVAALRARGVAVFEARADISDPAALRAALASLPEGVVVKGAVHCAGTLDDAVLANQSGERFAAVARPKIGGALALRQAAEGLEHLVVFSSAAGVIGSAGQANYAAANAAMDGLVRLFAAEGLAAKSVDFGPWAGGGMAQAEAVRRRMNGISPFTPEQGFAVLDEALASLEPQVCAIRAQAGWRSVSRSLGLADDPLFEDVAAEASTPPARPAGLREVLKGAAPEARHALLAAHVQAELARILGDDQVRLSPTTPFHDKGVDSLMSVELRNALAKSLDIRLPATLALDYPTLKTLCEKLLTELFPATTTPITAEFADIERISDDEAEALLIQELETLDV